MNRMIGVVSLLALLVSANPAHAANLSWNLPTSYTDGTPIVSGAIATIVTNIYSGPSRIGPWTVAATTPPGAVTATIPDSVPVQTVWYTVTAVLDGMESDPSAPATRTPIMYLTGAPTANGSPLSAGDEVSAYSVHPRPGAPGKWDKTLITRWVIGTTGIPGGVPAYGDDPATAGVVEGAVPGEEICLVLRRPAEGKMYWAYTGPAGQPASVVWTGNGETVAVDVDFVEGERIPLRNGEWNLVSYGVLKGYHRGALPPATPQLDNVVWEPVATVGDSFPLRSIAGRYDRVLGNDGSGATFWNPSIPSISTLSYLAPGYGYWIKMNPSTDNQALSWMTVPGPFSSGTESLSLNAGWTLAGYWGNRRTYFDNSVSYDASGDLFPLAGEEFTPLSSIGEIWGSIAGDYALVTSFDGLGAHLWNPSLPQTRTLRYLGPGYGYWIKMNAPGTLAYPAGTW